MDEKLKQLIAENKKYLLRAQEDVKKLTEKIEFYKEHKFEEEERIAWVKYNAMNSIVYSYKAFIEDIEEIMKPHKKKPYC